MKEMSTKKQIVYYTLIFFGFVCILFSAFILQKKSLVWEADGYRQYYPALRYLGDYYQNAIRGGKISTMDYTLGQGEDVITTLSNYGYGDPLTFLAALTPAAYTEYLYDFLILLRFYLAGLAFLVFLRDKNQKNLLALTAVFIYLFSGFGLWSIRDPFFLNAMIYLPLMIMGMEKVKRGESLLWFSMAVFLCACSGYYFFYMNAMAVVVLYVIEFLYRPQKPFLKPLIRVTFAGVFGTLASFAILLPNIYALRDSTRKEGVYNAVSLWHYSKEYVRLMLVKLFAVTNVNDNAWAVGYLSTSVVIIPAILLVCKNWKRRKNKCYAILLGLCMIAMFVPVVAFGMNGFRYVTNRYMYVVLLALAYIFVDVMPEADKLSINVLWTVCTVVFLGTLLLGKDIPVYEVTVLFFLMVAMVGLFMFGRKKPAFFTGIFLFTLCNLLINGNLLYQPFGANMTETFLDAGTVEKEYHTYTKKVEGLFRKDKESLGRVDVTNYMGWNPNQSLVTKLAGISQYYSVISEKPYEYLNELGIVTDLLYKHRRLGVDGRSVLSHLSNVHYVTANNSKRVPFGFEKVKGIPYLYQNTYDTSLGYTYEDTIQIKDYEKLSALEKESILSEALVVEEGESTKVSPTVIPETVSLEFADFQDMQIKDETIQTTAENGFVTLKMPRNSGYEYFLQMKDFSLIRGERNESWGAVRVGKDSRRFCINDATYDFHFDRIEPIFNLGNHLLREKEEVSLRLNGPALYHVSDIQAYRLNMPKLMNQVEDRMEESLEHISYEKNVLYGDIRVSQPKWLCLAVTDKPGYQLYVDGVKTSYQTVNRMYIGTKLSKGYHEIELKYQTPGLYLGIIFSILGILCSFLWDVFERLRANRRQNQQSDR